MKKRWNLIYIFMGSFIYVLLTLICILGFFNSEITSKVNKYNFESIYLNTNYDFVVPSPSLNQVSELESADNGISVVTPYYSFAISLELNKSSVQSNVLMFDDYNKIKYTPYNYERIVKGTISEDGNIAIVDQNYSKKNDCTVGDIVSLQIGEKKYNFNIVAISENNTSYDEGSIALVISNVDSLSIYTNNSKYGGAFITASDYEKCKAYLNESYKPLGRLKDRSQFDSEETYNLHVSNFNNADWSQEVTDMRFNYSSLSVKYENVDSNINSKNVIQCVIIILFVLIFNIALLILPSQKKLFIEFLSKKNGSIKDIRNFYLKGNIYGLVIFSILMIIAMIFKVIINGGMFIFDQFILLFISPIIAILAGFAMSCIADLIIVKGLYSRK